MWASRRRVGLAGVKGLFAERGLIIAEGFGWWASGKVADLSRSRGKP